MAILEASTADTLARRARSHYERGPLIDKERYTSRDFLALENERVFRRTWQVVCRASELANVGDYQVHTIGGESILVVREAPDRLRALSNVCRHRATHLKSGSGNAADLRCPFHGWRYSLDGALLEIRNSWDFPHVDPSWMCLPEFRVEAWQGFVFVNLNPDAEPLLEFLEPLPSMFESFHLENFVRVFGIRIGVPCNWKLNLAAFIESYHAPWTHPSTAPTTNDVETRYDPVGRHGRMVVRLGPSPHLDPPISDEYFLEKVMEQRLAGTTEAELAEAKARHAAGEPVRSIIASIRAADAEGTGVIDTSFMSESQLVDTWSYNVFPNFATFASLQGMGFYSRFLPRGEDPDSSLMEVNIMMPLPEGVERPADSEHTEIEYSEISDAFAGHPVGELFSQDMANLQTVQQGVKSAYYPGVTLGLYQEALIRHAEAVLDRYLGAS
jgi:phenylpropionate dioxygenase-like ring-hydroxylating dioxygenase large terminal subunit